jgi:hypothetical protein
VASMPRAMELVSSIAIAGPNVSFTKGYTPYSSRPKVTVRKTLICSRLNGAAGQ